MQSRRRKYLWLILSASWLLLLLLGAPRFRKLAILPGLRPRTLTNWPQWLDQGLLPSFVGPEELSKEPAHPPVAPINGGARSLCLMETCFDTSRCQSQDFKVFVYPTGLTQPISELHHKVLASIEGSHYHTANPEEACLFVLPGDALDPQLLPLWNGGRNHLIFQLHPDSWPGLDFDPGQAMVARASPTPETFRLGFDVSLPFLPQSYPQRGGSRSQLVHLIPPPGEDLLAFEGQLDMWGTGSSIQRDQNAILNPSDHHGETIKGYRDGPCKQDHAMEQSEERNGLHNSTFCFIPPNCHVGSFRLLQALKAGCVPVLLRRGWELPFAEVIDWGTAAIIIDERHLLQIRSVLQGLPPARVLALRQQTQFLWDAYFSSVEKIVHSTLEIIRDRIFRAASRPWLLWNAPPGGLLALPTFSTHLGDFPFYYSQHGSRPSGRFSALIWVGPLDQPPLKLIQEVAGSQHCAQILVLWSSDNPPPAQGKWPQTAVPLVIIEGRKKKSDRFFPYGTIGTDAVLSLDAHSSLSTSEVDFAFVVWKSFPERIVGFQTWSHFWDETKGSWGYTDQRPNEFSVVLTAAAFYHRYYHNLFTHSLPAPLRDLVDELSACEDILMNFLVAEVTKLPPIKVPQRKQLLESFLSPRAEQRSKGCINRFASWFGHMPLVHSQFRLDPVLFKDQVSVLRKKYRQLERL
ncbi:LOW QUALITY PROTEIN: exostosin-like 1 [Antechinus flavipes]|uniref:LOW QUALITY PROTEIN: exostosin-like 1 n=1 Tax=Antechinus flavipes TaxID=38775 RepID=UPI0022354984|nr:LOW QUALITY PROTEIN: exostosin-like 1 [Antechinus flavipes]